MWPALIGANHTNPRPWLRKSDASSRAFAHVVANHSQTCAATTQWSFIRDHRDPADRTTAKGKMLKICRPDHRGLCRSHGLECFAHRHRRPPRQHLHGKRLSIPGHLASDCRRRGARRHGSGRWRPLRAELHLGLHAERVPPRTELRLRAELRRARVLRRQPVPLRRREVSYRGILLTSPHGC